MHRLSLAAFLFMYALSATLASAAALSYPPAPSVPATEAYFGQPVIDRYRNLENPADPQTAAWTQAETAIARDFLRSRPAYPAFRERIAALSGATISRSDLSIANGRLVYLRLTPPQAQPVLVARDGLAGGERVLFDPQRGINGRPPAIESLFLSHDGSKVAFTTQPAGSEAETLHVVDAATGKLFADTIPHVGGGTSPTALAWDGDGHGFIHTRYPQTGSEEDRHFNIAVYHHTLGTDPDVDPYLFGHGLPRTAEMQLVTSSDGRRTAIFVAAGDGPHESVYLRIGDGDFETVATPDDGIGSSGEADGDFVGETLYVVSHARDPRGEVVAIPPGGTFAQGHIVVPASPLIIEDVLPVANGFLTRDLDGGDSAARYFSTTGMLRSRLALPAQSAITELAGDPRGGLIVAGEQTYTVPNRWLQFDATTFALAPTGIENRTSGDYASVVVERVLVPSTDGKAAIPLEITRLKTTKLDGTAPTIVHAYGALGLVTSPHFLGANLAWLEHGGIYAQAMVRGGGEFGETWHTAARLATKTLSSDDLAACARWLESKNYSSNQHLGIVGGSAGGFLMGLALTRDPTLYRAVYAASGFYDLLRFETTPNGAFNVAEFGTVKDPAQFAWMRDQSPYEGVVKGRSYPAVLFVTGENDPRVDPYNSRKMAALLQSDAASAHPVLLLQQANQGHGFGNSLAQRIDTASDELTFFYDQLHG